MAAFSNTNILVDSQGNSTGNVFNSTNSLVSSKQISKKNQKTASLSRSIETVFNSASGSKSVGTALRMIQNSEQGVYKDAPSPKKTQNVQAVVIDSVSARQANNNNANAGDWRVSLEVPGTIATSPVLEPLINGTDGRMVFPFNPTIFMQQSANYTSIDPTHTNYNFYAYKNSEVNDITITGEFFVENANDAAYWVGCIHFLRTMTKMFYGESDPLGNPPMMTRLNGYGKHVLNNIPVLIRSFNVDMPPEVDYIPCTIGSEVNYVPAQSTISVVCTPNYARRSHSKFSLNSFADGELVGKPEGFI